MTQSVSDQDGVTTNAGLDPIPIACLSVPPHAPLPPTFRGMRADDMMGVLADAIDYEFLETVLGCRGRKVPKDIGL
jgi:hypothetical protein